MTTLENSQKFDELLKRLRNQKTDDEFIEAKACATKLSDSVWESVSAFANTCGGWLILGLDENTGFKPVRNFPTDKVLSQFVSGMGDSGSGAKLTNPPNYECHRVPCESEILLLIQIHELPAKTKPCYISQMGDLRGSYKRIDDRDILLSPAELFEIENVYITSRADLEPVKYATLDDLDETYCDLIIGRARQITPRAVTSATSREDRLANLNIINKDGDVTLAGLLCAGRYPQRFFPKLYIDVALHPDNEKSAPNTPRFLDRSICEGTLVEMLDDAVVAISKNLKRVSTVDGLERHDELEIPESVLREALANALVHREYGFNFQGQAVSVDIYPNRLEITSPGMLWGGKSIDNLDNGESCCRNATLMKLLLFAPFGEGGGATAEGNGSGIIQMKRTMQAKHLPEPEFVATFSSLKVIFWRNAQSERNTKAHSAASQTNSITEEASASSHKERMTQEASVLLELIQQNGEVGIAELKQLTGYSDSKIRARLNSLLDKKAITPTASKTSKNRKYRLS